MGRDIGQSLAICDFSIFEYLYCDAGNYKTWSNLLLSGRIAAAEIEAIRACLHEGEFFIAEQIGIPAVYANLWDYSGGPTQDDHVWHTFSALRPANPDEVNGQAWGTVVALIGQFESVDTWNEKLSPHWNC